MSGSIKVDRMPLVGILGNSMLVGDIFPVHGTGDSNIRAVRAVSACQPMIIPPDPFYSPVEILLEQFDGFVLPGGRANVHPSHYGHEETDAHGSFDPGRDAVALPLVRACVERGIPILGLCRGFQEIAVAFGATLHPEIRDLPGRNNHRMPTDGELSDKYSRRHMVSLDHDGPFAQLFGTTEIETNTLHGQGVMDLGPRLRVDGKAPDGTPEAIYVADAPGFVMGVQWHPEWCAEQDVVSHHLFTAFGDAVRGYSQGK